ncbi:MAG: ATP-binding protein [Polaromonas sp.]|nr:ATP-binding protein [Polaromonas sp.]
MISLELLGEGILVLDTRWHIQTGNRLGAALLHSPRPDLTGMDFWEAVQPKVADRHRQPVEAALRLQDTHVLVALHEFEGQWVEYSFRRHADGLVVTLRDATESQNIMRRLRDSEQRNHVLFGLNPNAMWIFDIDTLKIVAANHAAMDFYGIRQKKFLSLTVNALFPDREAAPLIELALAPGSRVLQPARPLLCRQKGARGDLLLVELGCSHIDWKGRPSMLVSLADVSDRHLAERGLQDINEELHRHMERCQADLQLANRDLDAFAQAMSHDLKDPLHVLNGFARALSRKYATVLDVQGQHYVERIQATTRQLAKLVDDLRTLTRLHRLPMVTEDIDLAPMCNDLIADLRRRHADREVLLEIPPRMVVSGDRDLLEMALANLLDNAWKFTAKKEQAWIRIGLAPVDDAGQEADVALGKTPREQVVFVSDNGAGFDPAYQDKLFMAFQRLHSSVDFPGNGLGLVIVRRATVRMGGRVWAETTDGNGASFFMALPPRPAAVPPVALSAASAVDGPDQIPADVPQVALKR